MKRAWWLAIGGLLLVCLLLGVCGIIALLFSNSSGGPLSGLLPGMGKGVYLVLEADVSRMPANERARTLEAASVVIQRRAREYGISRPVVKREGDNRIAVWLPGMRDVDVASRLVSQTGLLEFWEFQSIEGTPPANSALPPQSQSTIRHVPVPAKGVVNGEERVLTGQYFRRADVEFDPGTNQPVITFELNSVGAELFSQISARNVGKPVGVTLDKVQITSPVVEEPIIDGRGVIRGKFTLEEARAVVIQLNAGSLPVPLTVVETGSSPK